MIKEAFIRGFNKRAVECGLTEKQAFSVMDSLGEGLDRLDAVLPGAGGVALGAVPLAALGGGIGALIPSRDKKGKNHRLRNALIGAGAGGVAGGFAGNALDRWATKAIEQQNQELSRQVSKQVTQGVTAPVDKAVRNFLIGPKSS